METLRFLLVTTHFPPFKMGGDANFVGYLAEALAARGHEVHVAYAPSVYRILRGEPDEKIKREDEMDVIRHEFSPGSARLSLLLNLGLGTDLRSADWVDSVIRKVKPDVVHWHNTKGFVARPWTVDSAKTLYTAHDYNTICPRSNLLRPGERICDGPRFCQLCLLRWRKPPQLWRIGRRAVMDLPEDLKVLCPSEYMASRLRKQGVNVHSVLRLFVRDPGAERARAASPEDLLLFVGIMERRKGPQTLLKAFIESRKEQGFSLKIVGDGPLRRELMDMVTSSGTSDRVSIPGFLPRADIEDLLQKASMMAVPSEWPENAPLTTLEALSFGVPVIGTRLGGLPEILTEDTGSVLFDAGDVAQLRSILIDLWRERDHLGERRRKARKAYDSRFSPDAHVSGYLKIALE
ncbi:MAG: glycosyltransferase [Candidatus Thermoplasmatota archaeon]|nr:glycosyltransferase [Candidatus Thermoplasmatota archaeon]